MRWVKAIMVIASLVMVVGCGGFSSNPGVISQQDAVSDCGGYKTDGSPLFDYTGDYCAANVLHWQYDSATETLGLSDERILLNCCGDHSMKIEDKDGVYVITETDAPESFAGGARCACMCVFDYTLEAVGVLEDLIQIKIIRDVTDSQDGPQVVFEGQLDLTEGAGHVVIDETASAPGVAKNTEVFHRYSLLRPPFRRPESFRRPGHLWRSRHHQR